MKDFTWWCHKNQLLLNTVKTKEIVLDFWRPSPSPGPVNMEGVEVEVTGSYKNLGLLLDNDLDWSVNTDLLYQRGQKRDVLPEEAGIFYCLHKTPADVLSVVGRWCPFLCCGLLGRLHQEERHSAAEQDHQDHRASGLSGSHEAGLCGGSGSKDFDPDFRQYETVLVTLCTLASLSRAARSVAGI